MIYETNKSVFFNPNIRDWCMKPRIKWRTNQRNQGRTSNRTNQWTTNRPKGRHPVHQKKKDRLFNPNQIGEIQPCSPMKHIKSLGEITQWNPRNQWRMKNSNKNQTWNQKKSLSNEIWKKSKPLKLESNLEVVVIEAVDYLTWKEIKHDDAKWRIEGKTSPLSVAIDKGIDVGRQRWSHRPSRWKPEMKFSSMMIGKTRNA